MATGNYGSEDELLIEAIHALDEVRSRHDQLRAEIQARLSKTGKGNSEPFDLEAFKEEAMIRLAKEGFTSGGPQTDRRKASICLSTSMKVNCCYPKTKCRQSTRSGFKK